MRQKEKKVFNGKLMFSRRMKVKTFQDNQKIDANIVTASNDSEPAKSEGNKEGDINTQQQLVNEKKIENGNVEQKLDETKNLDENKKLKDENKEVNDQEKNKKTDEQVTEQPQIHLPTTIQPPISNEQPSEHSVFYF